MDPEVAEDREKWDEQNTADANRADKQPDDRRYNRKGEISAQPAAKLVSSLVRSTVSRFITA
jgi:hypothetical protein